MAKTGKEAERKQRSAQLEALTQGNVGLARALERRLASERGGTLEPLAELRPDEWVDLAYEHGVPPDLSLTPEAYAAALAANVEQQFPTAALVAHLAAGRRLAQIPGLKGVARFLWEHPGFDIVTANLNATTRLADRRSGPATPQLIAGLRSLQRLNELGATWEETAALLDAGYDSPADIVAAGPTEVAARLAGRIKPEERILTLYERAGRRVRSKR